jgi:hypothetical protein
MCVGGSGIGSDNPACPPRPSSPPWAHRLSHTGGRHVESGWRELAVGPRPIVVEQVAKAFGAVEGGGGGNGRGSGGGGGGVVIICNIPKFNPKVRNPNLLTPLHFSLDSTS